MKKNKPVKIHITHRLVAIRLTNLRKHLYLLKNVFRGHDKDVLENITATIENSIYTLERIMLNKDDAKKES